MRRALVGAAVATVAAGCASTAAPVNRGGTVSNGVSQAGMRVDTAATTTLRGAVIPGLERLGPGEPADPVQPLHIGLGLTGRDAAGLAALTRRIEDPHSAAYRRFLTPQQYAGRFGVEPAREQAALTWLRSGGLRITSTATGGTYVQAAGTLAQAERLFGIEIRRFASGGVSFLANTTAPSVPKALGVVAVLGLNGLERVATMSHPSALLAVRAKVDPKVPAGLGDYPPQDLWSIYDMPSANQGQGTTMAIIGAGRTDTVVADLRVAEQHFQLPQVPVNEIQVGAGPFTDDSNRVEWDLDTQASTGMAPQAAREDLYFASSPVTTDIEAALARWAGDGVDAQASASVGLCERAPWEQTGWNELVVEQTLAQAEVQGQTLFAAAGDNGGNCYDGIGVNGVPATGDPRLLYPAASPHAVGVGGTVLYSDGATSPHRRLEYAWNATGGGTSLFLPARAYQAAVPTVVGRCVETWYGDTSIAGVPCRGLPDVAALSGDLLTSGYQIYDSASGGWRSGAGTSLSSPLWLGMWARLQAAGPASGLGFAGPVLYAAKSSDFYDVVVGSNGIYDATPGWDYVSGLGVPDVAALLLDIDGASAAPMTSAAKVDVGVAIPGGGSGPAPAPSADPCAPLGTGALTQLAPVCRR